MPKPETLLDWLEKPHRRGFGCADDLVLVVGRFLLCGSLGSVILRREEPNLLLHAPLDGPKRILTRGSPWLCGSARLASRLPARHPEAFIEVFANVYPGLAADIWAHAQ